MGIVEDKLKDLKHFAIDTNRSLEDLLGEAIEDLVKEYCRRIKME